MNNKLFSVLLSVFLIASCGGGGSESGSGSGSVQTTTVLIPPVSTNPLVVAYLGDSLTWGSRHLESTDPIGNPANGLQRISPTPVEMVTQFGGGKLTGIDYGYPGASTVVMLAGKDKRGNEIVQMPFAPFDTLVSTDNASVYMIRYGGADFLAGVPFEEFKTNMNYMVDKALGYNKQVIIVGIIPFPSGTSEQQIEVGKWCDYLKQLAANKNLTYVDVRSLSWTTADFDQVHPTLEYAKRIAQLETTVLLSYLSNN